MSDDFNPKILGFLCNWCVMCTGRVDPAFILRGFIEGADGIFTGG